MARLNISIDSEANALANLPQDCGAQTLNNQQT